VNIVEVGPRDGLQNEPNAVSASVKAELINRLSDAGCSIIESGSFVSPKWVPQVCSVSKVIIIDFVDLAQMAGTDEVLKLKRTLPDIRYPVLVPNMKGLDGVLTLLDSTKGTTAPLTDEIAIFTATTDSFTKANTNVTVAESLERLQPVVKKALHNGLRVRGYVSMIIDCPFEGKVDPAKVREVSEKLLEMGCYQISLGDTTGSGTPLTWEKAIREVNKSVEMEMIAVSSLVP
jgi:hydroxymethylglutaryl-CoA lyase